MEPRVLTRTSNQNQVKTMKLNKQRTVNMPIKDYNSLKRKKEQLLKVKTLVAGSLDLIKQERIIEAKVLLADTLRILKPLR